jgi:hypothetical protein
MVFWQKVSARSIQRRVQPNHVVELRRPERAT